MDTMNSPQQMTIFPSNIVSYHIQDIFELSTRRLYHNDIEEKPHNIVFKYSYLNQTDEIHIKANVDFENKGKRYLHIETTDFAMWKVYLDYHTKMALIKTAMVGSIFRKTVEPTLVHSRLRIINSSEYRVSYNTDAVMRFIMTKTRAARKWDTAVRFDNTYTGVEWRYFRDHVKYRRID